MEATKALYWLVGWIVLVLACTKPHGEPSSQSETETRDPAKQPSAERPNFLLIVADDMGWTDIGSFGGEIETPNLDALAKRGVKFTDYHVSVSCSPSRSILLSGTDNHIAGLGNMGELITPEQRGKPGYEGYLNDRVVSLAEVLKDGGYHTYMAGKWHLGHEPEQFPRARGFERSLALLLGGASHWSDQRGLMAREDPAKFSRDGKELEALPGDYYSSKMSFRWPTLRTITTTRSSKTS